MLHLSSWMTTLPMMLIGMVGILLVIGIIVLAVMLLNRLTNRKYSPHQVETNLRRNIAINMMHRPSENVIL